MAKTPLKVIFLADTRPGHYHLAQGDCGAGPPSHRRGHADRGEAQWIVPTRWLRRRISAKTFFPPRMLRMAYRIDAYALPKADLVVSAGGETQMPNICVARFLGASSIFCGSLLRGLGPENFSLIISSYDRDAGSDRHMVVLKPSSIDPDALGRPASVPRYGPERHPQLAGLLIGGNAGPFRYRREEWERLLAFIAEISKAWGTRWLISTSRRTPDHVADRIAELARDESVVARFIDYGCRLAPASSLCRPKSSYGLEHHDLGAVSARLPVIGAAPAPTATDGANYRVFRAHTGRCCDRRAPPSRSLARSPRSADHGEPPMLAAAEDRLPDLF
jgi:hypothetical protein